MGACQYALTCLYCYLISADPLMGRWKCETEMEFPWGQGNSRGAVWLLCPDSHHWHWDTDNLLWKYWPKIYGDDETPSRAQAVMERLQEEKKNINPNWQSKKKKSHKHTCTYVHSQVVVCMVNSITNRLICLCLQLVFVGLSSIIPINSGRKGIADS